MKSGGIVLYLCLALVSHVLANTEKIILKARSSSLDPCKSTHNPTIPQLTPPYSQLQKSIIPLYDNNTDTLHSYILTGLQDGSNYEIRISYPAITPADFSLKTIDGCKTEHNSLSYVLQVSAEYTGVSHIEGKEFQPVVYDIVLENLYFQVFFYQVYKIVIAITAVICLGFFFVMPSIRKLISDSLKTE